ncbi:MAG: prepilin-type N-terminal cleavage/methylation domain-containing protein [Phycisphaerae bacterium]
MKRSAAQRGFTLLELLAVIAIVGLMVGLILPSFSRARRQANTTNCSTNLRTLGQGLAIYANEYSDMLVPHRMPKLDGEQWSVHILGGLKYRPTFLAMLGTQIGIPPFEDPKPTRSAVDCEGEPGDRQNYASTTYVCPEVANWTDERNACYGYNYQFLGNARLRNDADPLSFKNWPVFFSRMKGPAQTVAIGDSLGTAAAFPSFRRTPYEGENRRCDKTLSEAALAQNPTFNGRSLNARGNEGIALDPPVVDPAAGEVAAHEGDVAGGAGQQTSLATPPGGWSGLVSYEGGEAYRSAVDLRHGRRANILWLDGRVSLETLESLGYWVENDGSVGIGDLETRQGNNRFWSGEQRNRVWLDR